MKKLFILCGMVLFTSLMFSSCSKDEEEPVLPTLSLKQAEGFTTDNTTAAFGDTIRFGVIANGNGTDKLAKFKIQVNGQSVMDSTISTQNFTFNFYIIKSIAAVEEWIMSVTDISGNTVNKTVTITGQFGELDSYTTILMGAQDNVNEKSFLSLSNHAATTYLQAEAFEHQADIDMFCFFENNETHQNMMTLAAPGSEINGIFTGATSPDNYTTKNLTYYVKTDLSAAQFDAIGNDAVVLASYNAEDKLRKAKELTVGDVYSFLLNSGKYGLFKVIAVNGEETGTLEIAIKVQK